MLVYADGDLLKADAEAIVNPVNTVGVMGKGLALQFRQAYPDNFRAYQDACHAGEVRLGRMFTWPAGGHPRLIINFPTKRHWRERSRISDIAAGLTDLRNVIASHRITSIAVPALGCGLGGLAWAEVEPLIAALGDLCGVRVLVYPPGK